jgi:methyltransferase (TIGR00027 family)
VHYNINNQTNCFRRKISLVTNFKPPARAELKDAISYYNIQSEVLHMFEVDFPSTQTWKRARLEEAGITLPDDLAFAPVDFETQILEEKLRSAGYGSGKCTFFSWLGVMEYLTTEVVIATLRFIVSAPAGSGVVFVNYVV